MKVWTSQCGGNSRYRKTTLRSRQKPRLAPGLPKLGYTTVFRQLGLEPGGAGDRGIAAATNLVGFAAEAAFAGGARDEILARRDQVALEQVVVFALQMSGGVCCIVPAAVALEAAAGCGQEADQVGDFLARGGWRRGLGQQRQDGKQD